MARTNADGRANKGSQRQLQDFVNDAPSELNQHILGAIASLPRSAKLRWVSPLRKEEYREYSDLEFLAAVDQTAASPELGRFWPSGGPSWDALAIVNTSRPGVLLVEAKAHPDELESCCEAKDETSVGKIRASLDATKSWLGVKETSDWFSQYYQTANRLAHLYFLREIARVPAWLANIYFVDDGSYKPTARVDWENRIVDVERRLGLNGVSVPYTCKLFVNANRIFNVG